VFHRTVRFLLTVLIVGIGLVACGAPKLTADSKCKDYLQLPSQERSDTAVRLSSELGAESAGNPMWAMNLDYNCGQSPNGTLRSAFGL
jgi:hypothetical protein